MEGLIVITHATAVTQKSVYAPSDKLRSDGHKISQNIVNVSTRPSETQTRMKEKELWRNKLKEQFQLELERIYIYSWIELFPSYYDYAGSPMENNLKLISQVTVFTAVSEDKEMLQVLRCIQYRVPHCHRYKLIDTCDFNMSLHNKKYKERPSHGAEQLQSYFPVKQKFTRMHTWVTQLAYWVEQRFNSKVPHTEWIFSYITNRTRSHSEFKVALFQGENIEFKLMLKVLFCLLAKKEPYKSAIRPINLADLEKTIKTLERFHDSVLSSREVTNAVFFTLLGRETFFKKEGLILDHSMRCYNPQ
ncbi:hypothetical protein U0070_025103, partial [Myodes glareolus]